MQNAYDTARRLEDRFSAEGVTADIGGKTYHLKDWSVRGLALDDYDQEHERGERLRATVTVSDAAGEFVFDTGLFVVRADPASGALAAVFVDYGREAALLLDKLFPLD